MFEKLYEGAYLLKIPFENIYTSVFLFVEGNHAILLDSGCNDKDVEDYILPSLHEMGVRPTLLLCSHLHSDHCGGIPRLLKEYTDIKVGLFAADSPYCNSRVCKLTDNQIILNRFKVLNLKGHTPDCLALWDKKTNILFSCDSLQAKGIDKYPTNYCNKTMYLNTLNRVKDLDLACIIASHEYEPYGDRYESKDEIKQLLGVCVESL